ncbi:STAGA complex 65 subunit gamma-like [Biomphalaria glabrata]|uniref:STAGA complex 65 subunit gamma-like n=1 Tax=Biomphalaria glabrata TaxID=6526 RepID=A0A9W3B0U5_BIOGL|nr:STAGA complex 65 subunit gamma-like [Biomphalaria glabrata]XP_055893090.1 STAGA complex 65 subunit gamma-like [Biomphalaria glabrata]XP_055893091.1 STAGA complex 65 subunit gamma-like [Biomphalaria glabrata]XP_055893093.1 STAGA complex 65 subunit gamma-like [Biomphalaria glabrata]XP_055893094.1 STAGA complex 65 subunit gamma-like [Biomphalaria glabrata]
MATSYWGEIPQVADTESGIAAIEREQITKPRPMDIEGPLLHQPSSRHHPPTNEVLPSDHFQMDPLVIHTIRLIQHIKKVKAAIATLQQDIKQEPDLAPIAVGPTPQYDGKPVRNRSKQKYFTEEDYNSDFVRGVGKPPSPIDEVTCRKLLRRSTAAICAHLSFDNTQESVLETLTDVCQEFLIQFTRHLGMAADRRAMYGCGGFPDIIERVFYEMGLGSITCLNDFYQQRILAYHKKKEEQCQLLMAEYNRLNKQPISIKHAPQSPSGTDTLHVIRIKDEANAEIQFPLLDDNDEVNEAEQLLNIESLGTFEITVEHETATGLTTEVETKWSHGNKGTVSDSRVKVAPPPEETAESHITSDEASSHPSSNIPKTPQSAIPQTPQDAAGPLLREFSNQDDATIQEPGSLSSMDIFSPSVPTPSKAKKKKKN